MANEKVFQSRIQLKHDTEENWLKAVNFVPKEGEILIYDADNNNSVRIKIGDGIKKVNELPFLSEDIKADISSKSSVEIVRW